MKFHASYSSVHALRLGNLSFRCFSPSTHPRRKETRLKLIKRFDIYEQNTKSVIYAPFSMFLFRFYFECSQQHFITLATRLKILVRTYRVQFFGWFNETEGEH